MKQVFIKNGAAVVEDVPAPAAAPGEVLVRVANSCISVGTEMSGLQATSEPIWKRAARRPNKVLNAIKMLLTRGVDETVNIVRGQISAGSILGYSAAGTVVGLGAGVEDIEIGDRVACPPAPNRRFGAIALQGVRRAEPTLGETFVVVGLGLIGQLTAQMLKANGCRVISIDLDPRRVELAKSKPRKSPSRWNRPYRPPANPKLGRGSSVKHQTLTKTTESARCAASSER